MYKIHPGGNQLVAFLVTKKNQTLDEKGLRTFLKKKFPEFMVPRLYVTLKKLPRSSTGKIDRKALPDPGKIATAITSTSELPRSTFEKQVAKIISNILEIEQIGLHDNFFELGGHSLLATRVISKIREEFDVDIPLTGFFEDPTVAGVCAIITHRKTEMVDAAKLDQLLTEVENLSDEDLLNLLED
jgi:acyl carrier protein